MRCQYFVAALVACSLTLLTGCPVGPDLAFAPGIDPGGNTAPGGNVDPGTPAAATPIPSKFQGKWQTTLTYVPAFYTGVVPVDNFNGSIGVSLYLGPDGRYQFELDSAMAYFGGNCFRTTTWTENGTVSMAVSDFTFTPAHAIDSILDSCGQARLIDPAPVSPASHTLTLDQDQTGWPTLHFSLPNGEELLLEKCRNCG